MVVVGTGLVSAVGMSARASCAAIRAGISNFSELPFIATKAEPVVGACVPLSREDLRLGERLVEMLTMALRDCLQNHPIGRLERVPLLVGLAEVSRPGVDGDRLNIIARVEERLGARFHSTFSRTFHKGHASGFEAMSYARDVLGKGEVQSCLVCGVDSYIDPLSLWWLERHWRLKMPENSDGVIPGEAAAVLLLQNQVAKAGEAALKVLGIGLGREEAHILSGRPLLGLGLTNATHLALEDAEVELGAVDFRLSDVTGESYGFKEQSIVLSRVLRGRRTCFPLWHFSDAIGDIGAAAGAVLVTMASHAFQEGYALGDRAICFCSSVDGERGVAVLQRGQSGITS